MITRKIPFALIFALLLSPIHAAADGHFGAVVKKSPETVAVETAGKQAAKILLGKAAYSIFGNEPDGHSTTRPCKHHQCCVRHRPNEHPTGWSVRETSAVDGVVVGLLFSIG